MKGGLPLCVQGEVGLGLQVLETGGGEESLLWSGSKRQRSTVGKEREPTSVLEQRRSPSPLTSASTPSSSRPMAAVSDNPSQHWPPSNSATSSSAEDNGKEEWASELQPILAATPGFGVHDLDAVLSSGWVACGGEALHEPLGPPPVNPGFACHPIPAMAVAATLPPPPSPGINPSLATSSAGLPPVFLGQAVAPSLLVNTIPLPHSLPSGLFCQEPVIGHNLRQHMAVAYPQQAILDQLVKAAELLEAQEFTGAHGILARLNQCLPSPTGKPLIRTAFYFKEALRRLLTDANLFSAAPPSSPLDVALKIDAHKAFSEVSPILQFTYFTCTQALLEALDGADRIHVIDFDIGVGGQWSSFVQELAHRHQGAPLSLRITVIASPCSHSVLELHLTRESLSHFTTSLNVQFEFNVLSLDSLDTSTLLALSSGADEATAVNLPPWSGYHPPFPTIVRLVRQLSPKIVIWVDHGCYRSDLSFSQHLLSAFHSCNVFLDSIDALGTSPDVVSKVERFLLQPRIEEAVIARYHSTEKMLPSRTVLTSAGFMPSQFSNITEIQAEFLLKRVQVRGFHVEKRQASLSLCWQRKELVTVSAWRC